MTKSLSSIIVIFFENQLKSLISLGIFRNFAQNLVVSHSQIFHMRWTDVKIIAISSRTIFPEPLKSTSTILVITVGGGVA